MKKDRITETGICPNCGGPTDYIYEIEGPIIKDDEPFIEIKYSVKCKLCGFEDTKSMYISINGLYPLRYLLTPRMRLVLERIKILSDIKKSKSSSLIAT